MIIFGSPKRYLQGPDALHRIGEEIKRLGQHAVLLADRTVGEMIGTAAKQSCDAAGVTLTPIRFGGEITRAEVERLSSECGHLSVHVVVAAGGGKTIDAGKCLADKIGARLVTVPTVASNDSPTSHIAVIYDENHKLVGVDKFGGNPDLVLVDTSIIAKAPAILLSAGIGDAVVKKFEVGQCAAKNGTNMFGGHSPLTAVALANVCYDILRKDAVGALEAVRNGRSDPALERIVEACVLMSGLAFESGGLSISHAMTRGLSAVKGPAEVLHGLQVAYGLLVQLQLEGRDAGFMADMRRFYRQTGLPVSLAELNFKGSADDRLMIATLTNDAPHMKHFVRPLTPQDIVAAMDAVEAASLEAAGAA